MRLVEDVYFFRRAMMQPFPSQEENKKRNRERYSHNHSLLSSKKS